VLRILVALLILVAIVLAWVWLISAIGIWWMLRRPPAPIPGTDTYFITSSWVYRLAVILPLVLFTAWYWRRVFSRAT
jgi:hypothetical protein